ncbi:MAG: hypothetical protein KF774_13160 [Planctomyces sp.]|nr:hypothetical protein [Planctomyces sp.]
MEPFNTLGYLDPGSGSLLLQALVGGGAGLVVFGKYIWDAVRRTFAAPSPLDDLSR